MVTKMKKKAVGTASNFGFGSIILDEVRGSRGLEAGKGSGPGIYGMSEKSLLARDYGLKDQMRRAAVSVMSNLAEGFERTHAIEKIQMYKVARASAGEVRSLLYVLEDQEMIEPERVNGARRLVEETGSMITGLIRSTEKYAPKK